MAKEGTKPKLTTKQMAFVCAYLQCFNGAKAARLAGYSEDNAKQAGHENLTKTYVMDEITRRLDTEGITPARIKIALSGIAFDEDVELQHRLSGLDKLTKISGMYVEKIEHSGRIDSVVSQEKFEDMTDDRRAIFLRTAGVADVLTPGDGADTPPVGSSGV